MSPASSTVPEYQPLRWGILGTGHIAHKFVSDLVATGTGLVVACGSRSTERARSFATEFNIPKAYGSYGELLRDQEVEAVYVATPHSAHHPDSVAALRSGKHVLCEKPISINSFLVNDMFTVAGEHGCFLMEGLWSFFLPAMTTARRWITEGKIGEIRLVDAEFGFAATALSPSHRLLNPALGGGALLDVGIYPIALTQWIAGNKPPKVKAISRIGETGVDLTTSVLLEWARGIQANLRCSIAEKQQRPAVIFGTEGTITLPEFWKGRSATLETAGEQTVFTDKRETWGYEHEVEAFTEAVRAGRTQEPVLSRAYSQRLSATLDAVRKQIGLSYPADDEAARRQGSDATK